MTNRNVDVIQDYEYDAFGVEKTEEASDATALYNPFRYCGEYFGEELGCIYLRARYYDPKNGRMITEDPYWRALDKPTCDINAIRQSINLYGYCLNNPISFTDPSGLDAIILVNTEAAPKEKGGIKITLGHMGVLVQNAKKKWYYFSCGSNYVDFKPVREEELQDLEAFSKKYYGGYKFVGAYNQSVYIKGDFTKGYEFFKKYNRDNIDDGNASGYDAFTNNCAQVVLSGFLKGTLNDGTNVSSLLLKEWAINTVYQYFLNGKLESYNISFIMMHLHMMSIINN